LLRFEHPHYAAIAAALVVVGGGAYVALVSNLAPTPVVASPEPPPLPPPAASHPNAPELTTLSIDTLPANATVSMDGTKIGITPLEIEVPKNTQQITLEITLAGYTTLRQFIVPDANQRLRLSLTPATTTARPAGSTTATPSTSTTSATPSASVTPSASAPPSASAAPSGSSYYRFE